MPSLRTSIVNAAFLCFALVMGEFTIANILLYTKPFPVWLVQLPATSGQVQAATSLLSLLIVEILLLLIGALQLAPRRRKEQLTDERRRGHRRPGRHHRRVPRASGGCSARCPPWPGWT